MWSLQKFLPKKTQKAVEKVGEVIKTEQVAAPVKVNTSSHFRSNV
jgi:hypothetical protein